VQHVKSAQVAAIELFSRVDLSARASIFLRRANDSYPRIFTAIRAQLFGADAIRSTMRWIRREANRREANTQWLDELLGSESDGWRRTRTRP
jgi:hypothetical protein